MKELILRRAPGPRRKDTDLLGWCRDRWEGEGGGKEGSRAPGPPKLLRDSPAITKTGVDRGEGGGSVAGEFVKTGSSFVSSLQSVALLQKGPENKQRSLLFLVFN